MSETMEKILKELFTLEGTDDALWGLTPNQIGSRIGVPPVFGGRGQGGKGKGHRAFGPAQRVIFPLTALKKRGFVESGERKDGLSGVSYSLTMAGKWKAEELIQDNRR